MSFDLLLISAILLGLTWKFFESLPTPFKMIVDCSPFLFSTFPTLIAIGMSHGVNPTQTALLHTVAALVDIASWFLLQFLLRMKETEIAQFKASIDHPRRGVLSWSWWKPLLSGRYWIVRLHDTVESWGEKPTTLDLNELEAIEEEKNAE